MKTFLFLVGSVIFNLPIIGQGLNYNIIKMPCKCDGTIEVTGLNPSVHKKIRYGGYSQNKTVTITSTSLVLNDLCGSEQYLWILDQNDNYILALNIEKLNPFQVESKVEIKKCPELSTAKLTIAGGTAPYRVEWYNEDDELVSMNNPAALKEGEYYFRVEDSKGCSVVYRDSMYVYLRNEPAFTLQPTVKNANCTDGSIEISNINGGTAPFTYKWNDGSTNPKIENLTTGAYGVEVTDSKGCSVQQNIYVSQLKSIYVNTTVKHSECQYNNGEVKSFVSGDGKAPYTYQWNNGLTTKDLKSIAGGNYFVTVTDSKGCLGFGSAYIDIRTPITAEIKNNQPSSCTKPTGSASLEIKGGKEPYEILWNTFPIQSGNVLKDVPVGTYHFSIVDINKCSRNGSVTIHPESQIFVYPSVEHENCGSSNGKIKLFISTDNPPYQINWDDNSSAEFRKDLKSGSYRVKVTNAKSCSVEKTIDVNEISPMTLGFITSNSSCVYSKDGTIESKITGGTPPYTYLWSNGLSSSKISGMATGYYWLHVTDAIGCRISSYIFLDYDKSADHCYCTIKGIVYYDENNNCIQDGNEKGIRNMGMHLQGFGYTFTDKEGLYSFKAPSGDYILSEIIQVQYPLSDCVTNQIALTTSSAAGCVKEYNFANKLNPLRDIHISNCGNIAAVPGYPYSYKMLISNYGTTDENKVLTQYSTDGQIGVPSFLPISFINSNGNQYDYSAFPLEIGETKEIIINYMVPTNIPLNTEVWFDEACAYESPIENWEKDNTPWNNVNSYYTTVLNSYDPNFIKVNPQGVGSEGIITRKDNILEYIVHFQNLGNYFARRVRLEITLDKNLDWKKLKPVYSSLPSKIEMTEKGQLFYYFEDIKLLPQSQSEEFSKGYVIFTVPLLNGLPEGAQIQCHADIFFDFNPAVTTNKTLNTIEKLVSTDNPAGSLESIQINPNPLQDQISIEFYTSTNEILELELLDLFGRKLMNKIIHSLPGKNIYKTNLGHINNGFYFLQIQTNKGAIKTKKIEIFH